MNNSNLFYRENLLDHSRNPRNYGPMPDFTRKAEVVNRHCGDSLVLYIKEKNGKIAEAQFEGSGCFVSISSASMLVETLVGKDLSVLNKIKKKDILKNFGRDLTPSRQQCALLVYQALDEIINGRFNKEEV